MQTQLPIHQANPQQTHTQTCPAVFSTVSHTYIFAIAAELSYPDTVPATPTTSVWCPTPLPTPHQHSSGAWISTLSSPFALPWTSPHTTNELLRVLSPKTKCLAWFFSTENVRCGFSPGKMYDVVPVTNKYESRYASIFLVSQMVFLCHTSISSSIFASPYSLTVRGQLPGPNCRGPNCLGPNLPRTMSTFTILYIILCTK